MNGKECILVKCDINAAIFRSIGLLGKKLFILSVVVGFLYMPISSFYTGVVLSIREVYGTVFFICRVKLYVVVYLVYVRVDVLWANFCFFEYD